MTDFLFFVAKTTAYRILVVVITVVISLILFGSTLEKVLIDRVRAEVVEASAQEDIQFRTLSQRQAYLDEQFKIKIKDLGLDEPWYSPKRFINTLFATITLDLGQSNFFTSDSGSSKVSDIIIERVPKTILLFTTSTVVVVIIGLFLGTYMAEKRGSILDKGVSFVAVISNSFAIFWVGMLMILLFSFSLDIFPARSTPLTSPGDPFYVLDLLYHMMLPLITLVIFSFAVWSFVVRYFISRVLDEDYIQAKRVMGIPKRKILFSHALKNAAPPILTGIVTALIASISGSFIVEAVFDWPGVGKLLYDAILVLDIPIILGSTYVFTLMYVMTMLIADLLYAYFDPRVKVSS
ncbi:MAG TPA: ABC transporter permease [Nitrososphaeraceae archaeon]|jgi:peptide/nickel transport system permease protein|nr:ABC transporter permease [Nitrososphaeraceae archaeon]